MKPEIYYENKNSHIIWMGTNVTSHLPIVHLDTYSNTKKIFNLNNNLSSLKNLVFEFVSLVPDQMDGWTDETWVQSWKYIYKRLSERISEIKELRDYKNDPVLEELSKVARVMLAARHAVFWVK